MWMIIISIISIFFINQGGSSECSYTSYGDVMKLNPTGASKATAKSDKLEYHGTKASNKMLETDLNELNRIKHCYEKVGTKYCIHPAVIAAIASRETRGGSLVKGTDGWGDKNKARCGDCNKCNDYCAYGILQCDIKTSGLGENGCSKHTWDSCEHLDMMVERVLVSKLKAVKKKHKDSKLWPPEKLLQGGIAAYNFGVKNVQSPGESLDKGSSHDDYSNDVVARAQHLVRKYKWGEEKLNSSSDLPTTGCQNMLDLAKQGNCDFYSCVEQAFPCSNTGYALGYGQRYCNKFALHKDTFTSRGQLWIDNVRKCLMLELWKYLQNEDKTCETVKEFAFDSHPECYVNSDPGICVIIMDSENREGLLKVFEWKDFFGEDYDYALWQVIETMMSCSKQHLKNIFRFVSESQTIDSILEKIKSSVDEMKKLFRKKTQVAKTDRSDACRSYAESGDCRFYECMQKRFPCELSLGVNHMIHFELVSCSNLKTAVFYNGFGSGILFSANYQKCLMTKLLPSYEKSDIDCLEMAHIAHTARRDCLVQSGICSLDKADLVFEVTNNLHGYPYMSPRPWHMVSLGSYYYRNVKFFQNQVADALCECRAGSDRVCDSSCRLVYNQEIQASHCVMNQPQSSTKSITKGDPKCDAVRGTCSLNSKSCEGTYSEGLCTGADNRQCCVPYDDKDCTDVSGICQYKSSSTCTGGYLTGKCPGPTDRKCCVPASECTVEPYSDASWFIGDAIHADSLFHSHLDTIKGYAQSCGVQIYITHSWRKSGSVVNGAIVQPASNSDHLVGHAIDFNLKRTSDNQFCNSVCLLSEWSSESGDFHCFLNKTHQDSGLRWGGVWGTPDPVHIDDHMNSDKTKYKALRDKLQAACINIPQT